MKNQWNKLRNKNPVQANQSNNPTPSSKPRTSLSNPSNTASPTTTTSSPSLPVSNFSSTPNSTPAPFSTNSSPLSNPNAKTTTLMISSPIKMTVRLYHWRRLMMLGCMWWCFWVGCRKSLLMSRLFRERCCMSFSITRRSHFLHNKHINLRLILLLNTTVL